MPYLVVAPLSAIAETASRHGTREMISLLGEGHAFHRPAVVSANRHLRVDVNDIAQRTDGLVLAQSQHVEALLAFARDWDRSAPLLIHCWMGISRSPAAALLVASLLAPDRDEEELALTMRRASPFVTPNERLIALGDAALGRGGRLVRAVHAIGRGADAYEGSAFRFDLSAPAGRETGR